jgi:Na+/alanine symporter
LFVPDAFWKEEVRGVRVEAVIAEAVRIGVAASMIKNDLGRASESRECILADTQRQSTKGAAKVLSLLATAADIAPSPPLE